MKSIKLILIAALVFLSSTAILASEQETIPFNIQNEPLIDIVNRLSAQKNLNIIFPVDQAGLQVKVNFPLPERISPQRAWEFMETFLQMAGFIITPKADDFAITPVTNIDSTPLPLWGGNFSPECLPSNDEPIRYIYTFVNINISDNSAAKSNLQAIFKDMLPGTDSKVLFDGKSNSVLITGSAAKIKGVMNIVQELDITGFRESVEVLPLQHAQASVVVQIINKLIPDAQGNKFYPMPQQQAQRTTFFSKNTRVVSIPSSNSIAIMGKIESVERVSKFIHKYLDTPPDSGKNILHIKHLNNLNSEQFAGELTNLVKSKMSGSQSTGKSKDEMLSGVIIVAQKADQGSSSQQGKLKETEISKQAGGSVDLSDEKLQSSSGNNLIVAAKENDWKMIEHIIDQLDRPQLQVAFEVLIAEITVSDKKLLEAQMRGSEATCDPPNVAKWQSAQITQPVLNYERDSSGAYTNTIDSSQGLDANLLPVANAADPKAINIAALASAGHTILSYKSTNGILGILEMLSQYKRATILSQPFLVTSNHQQASIDLVDQRLANGSADTASTGGPVTINSRKLDAALSVLLYPHISISNNINLQILVKANEFINETSSTRTIRTITTNANVHNQEVLVLGGLTKVKTGDTVRGTPGLSSIPIVGNLFKKRSKDYDRSILLIFIAPTIIRPLLSGGVDSFTEDKSRALKGEMISAGENFESMNNPISRIVFPYDHFMSQDFNNSIDLYLDQGSWTEGGGSLAKKVEATNLKRIVKQDQKVFEKEHQERLSNQEKTLEASEKKEEKAAEKKKEAQRARKKEEKKPVKKSVKKKAKKKPPAREQDLKKTLENQENPFKRRRR